MTYDIQIKNDFSGAMLVVRFPEEELDRKALYTIETDQPDFLLPFRHRSVDGQVECIYQLGDFSKLQYRFGRRSTEEGVALWEMLLRPLLECRDWFLNPFSFALNVQQIYVNKEGKRIGYVYIPSKRECAGPDDLRTMVSELAQQNPMMDPELENKILRAIMQEFNPKGFLKMLREFKGESAPSQQSAPAAQLYESAGQVQPVPVMQPAPQARVDQPPVRKEPPVYAANDGDDIVINLDKGTAAKEKKTKGVFGKAEKQSSPKEHKAGLFAKKEKKQKGQKEIVLGAAERSFAPEMPQQTRPQQMAPVWTPAVEESDETQLGEVYNRTCLRLVGDPSLPREIPVEIGAGQVFTIGRFDVSVGHAQSDFEFDKKTKAISRHHAAIERRADGSYVIVDLSSSAGTFVNGERLGANVPCRLTRGCRVAFGTSGADYIWEEV